MDSPTPNGEPLRRLAEDLLMLEADLLDRRDWQAWLDLYVDDCLFWVPAWASEDVLVEDPEVEVNMIYIAGKPGLEARLFRLTSRGSYASFPLPVTAHLVGNVRVTAADRETVSVSAKWSVLSVDVRRGKVWRGGWYDYVLARGPAGLKIRQKKIVLLEDVIDGTIDIFQL